MTANHVHGPAIRVQGLKKSYKKLHVLRGVDLEVERGSILALLGSRRPDHGRENPVHAALWIGAARLAADRGANIASDVTTLVRLVSSLLPDLRVSGVEASCIS